MHQPRPLHHLPRCELGEGPHWDAESGRLYWVDISGHAVHRWTPESDLHETHDAGTLVGFAVVDRDDRLVVGLRDGIYAMPFGGHDQSLIACPAMPSDNRFNDGACDPCGRLWAGTMHVAASRDRTPSGSLYRLRPNGLEEVEGDLGIANGIGWSPSGGTMYFSDTHRGRIWSYDYDLGTGSASNRRPFADVPIDIGVPDGLTVDSTGRVYVAVWRGARVNVYAPDGALEEVIAMPVPHATSCCFGGADLRTLYISTSYEGLSPIQRREAPHAGLMFAMPRDAPGLRSARMQVF
jgi:D-xylonolactonase